LDAVLVRKLAPSSRFVSDTDIWTCR